MTCIIVFIGQTQAKTDSYKNCVPPLSQVKVMIGEKKRQKSFSDVINNPCLPFHPCLLQLLRTRFHLWEDPPLQLQLSSTEMTH